MYVTIIKNYKNLQEIITTKILETDLLMHLSTFRYTHITCFSFCPSRSPIHCFKNIFIMIFQTKYNHNADAHVISTQLQQNFNILPCLLESLYKSCFYYIIFSSYNSI